MYLFSNEEEKQTHYGACHWRKKVKGLSKLVYKNMVILYYFAPPAVLSYGEEGERPLWKTG